MSSFRKLIAFICLSAIVLAAIAPSGPGLFWAIVVPLLLFGLLEAVPVSREPENADCPAVFFLSLLATRAPPLV